MLILRSYGLEERYRSCRQKILSAEPTGSSTIKTPHLNTRNPKQKIIKPAAATQDCHPRPQHTSSKHPSGVISVPSTGVRRSTSCDTRTWIAQILQLATACTPLPLPGMLPPDRSDLLENTDYNLVNHKTKTATIAYPLSTTSRLGLEHTRHCGVSL